jgi:putative transposon-encoded protein
MGALLLTRIIPGSKSMAILGGPTQIESKERIFDVPDEKKSTAEHHTAIALSEAKVKFEVYGEEMIEKKVRLSGNSGRVYLPPDWVDHHVKIIRID